MSLEPEEAVLRCDYARLSPDWVREPRCENAIIAPADMARDVATERGWLCTEIGDFCPTHDRRIEANQ